MLGQFGTVGAVVAGNGEQLHAELDRRQRHACQPQLRRQRCRAQQLERPCCLPACSGDTGQSASKLRQPEGHEGLGRDLDHRRQLAHHSYHALRRVRHVDKAGGDALGPGVQLAAGLHAVEFGQQALQLLGQVVQHARLGDGVEKVLHRVLRALHGASVAGHQVGAGPRVLAAHGVDQLQDHIAAELPGL